MKTLNPILTGFCKSDTLGRRMYEARAQAGLSRKDAAAKIGLSAAQLGRIERDGVSMVSDPRSLVRAAHAYGVSDVWLYAGSMAPPKLIPGWYAACSDSTTEAT